MEEAIEIMRLTAKGLPVTFAGTYRQFRDVAILPQPVQQPVPIWIAANPDPCKPGNVASAFRRVARLADGWQTTHTTPEQVARSIRIIHAYAKEEGRTLGSEFPVSILSNICVDDSPERAWAEASRFLNAHSSTHHEREFLERWVVAGRPEDCISGLRRFIEAGATSILLRPSSFDQETQFRRISADVLPAFR